MWSMQHGPWLENVIAIDAGSEVIVIDTLPTPQAAAKAKAIIDSRCHKPVCVIINTHHHSDHSFGNQAFSGTTIAAHCWCAEADDERQCPTPVISGIDRPVWSASHRASRLREPVRAVDH